MPELRLFRQAWGWEVAWQHIPDIVTYRLTHGSEGIRYLKVAAVGFFPRLESEAERMRWAMSYLPVPEVAEHGSDGDAQWLVTRSLPGRDATHPFWSADPAGLVRILARGLRIFHEAPVEACPFDSAPRYLLRDGDGIYGPRVQRKIDSLGIHEAVTAPASA